MASYQTTASFTLGRFLKSESSRFFSKGKLADRNHFVYWFNCRLGYVGLPLAVEEAKVGFKVLGVEQTPGGEGDKNSGNSSRG